MATSIAEFSFGKVANTVNLPCTVQVVGGIRDGRAIHGVRCGDVLDLLESRTISKVTGRLTDSVFVSGQLKPYDFEINIPLAYTGKMKVVNEIKTYELISAIFEDMPRFVRMKEKLIFQDGSTLVELDDGCEIEIISRQYGQTRGFKKDVDKLRIRYDGDKDYCVPVNTRSKFRSEPDNTLYTIAEAVDRFPLPIVATFQDDLLFKLFAERYPNCARLGFTSSETIRLDKTTTHDTLICRLDKSNAKRIGKPRSKIVLLPLDDPEVNVITVRVLDGEPDAGIRPDYENIEDDEDEEETVEDVLKQPELTEVDDSGEDYEDIDPSVVITKGQPMHIQKRVEEKKDVSRIPTTDPGEYVRIEPKSTKEPIKSTACNATKHSHSEMGPHSMLSKIKNMFSKSEDMTNANLPATTKPVAKSFVPKKPKEETTEIERSANLYSDIDELKMDDVDAPTVKTRSETERETETQIQTPSSNNQAYDDIDDSRVIEKDFQALTVEEVRDRFILCGMEKLAKLAMTKRLNGLFFSKVEDEALFRDPFSLSKFEMVKFSKVKNNWKPKS